MSDKEVVAILSECLEEVKDNPTIIEVDIDSFQEYIQDAKEIKKDAEAKILKRGIKKLKKFNIDPPEWYKSNEENNASNLSNSNINNMEPNIMSENTTSNTSNPKEAEQNVNSIASSNDASTTPETVSVPSKSIWFAIGVVSTIVVGAIARAYQLSKAEESTSDNSVM